MADSRELVRRLDTIVLPRDNARESLDVKNQTLRWLVDFAAYDTPTAQHLEDAGLAALDKLPITPFGPGCLLRLLATPDLSWLQDHPWRPKLIKYLDRSIGSAFYSGATTEASQAHEKVACVVSVVEDVERRFGRVADALSNLDRLSTSIQAVFAQLNRRQGQILIGPFLPPDMDLLLKALLASAKAYVQDRDSSGAADLFATASEEARQARDSLTKVGLSYALVLASMVERLLTLLDTDFAGNAAAMPAKILVERDAKKFPLHLSNTPLQLSLLLRNEGPGYANSVAVTVDGDKELELTKDPMYVGRLKPGTTYRLEVQGVMSNPAASASMDVMVNWRNFDGTVQEDMFSLALPAQRPDVPWGELAERQPYSLEPVETEEDLVGRRELFQKLLARVTAKSAGSVILSGQKRVGKTSVAKALKSRLQSGGHVVLYLEAGDYMTPFAEDTLACLGTMICTRLKKARPAFSHLAPPLFSDALSPLTQFLDDLCELLPSDKRIVLILDEFDQLPLELYDRTPIGDAFFVSLRSLSSRRKVAFVIVGGERMTHIIDRQGQQLTSGSMNLSTTSNARTIGPTIVS